MKKKVDRKRKKDKGGREEANSHKAKKMKPEVKSNDQHEEDDQEPRPTDEVITADELLATLRGDQPEEALRRLALAALDDQQDLWAAFFHGGGLVADLLGPLEEKTAGKAAATLVFAAAEACFLYVARTGTDHGCAQFFCPCWSLA
jgi:hypothetical protein